jgi:hypothetical protein
VRKKESEGKMMNWRSHAGLGAASMEPSKQPRPNGMWMWMWLCKLITYPFSFSLSLSLASADRPRQARQARQAAPRFAGVLGFLRIQSNEALFTNKAIISSYGFHPHIACILNSFHC